MPSLTLSLLALLPALTASQQSIYGQCGGQGWTGATTCASGSTCVEENPYYSQCQPSPNGGGGSSPSSSSAKITTLATSTKPTTTVGGTTPSTTMSGGTGGASGTGPGTTLQSGWYWIRSVESPNFHKYLQTSPEYTAGTALMGDYTTAGQFNIINGQLVELIDPASGTQLYATVSQQANASETTLPLAFTTTQNTYGAFAFQGDAVTWTVASIDRPNTAAWYVCTGQQLLVNLGAYDYGTPANCADETIHYYNGATAVD